MAGRKIKEGLDYFPLNIDFFEDDKIELISSEYGLKGEMIAIKLLCKIYREGYYYSWSKKEQLLFAKRVGEAGSLVNEIVSGLIKWGFFDESVFNSFGILTSRGIQKRYFEAIQRRKSVSVYEKYLLIDISNYLSPSTEIKFINVDINSINVDINETDSIDVDINAINVDINSINADINAQRKGKERKRKESKGKREEICAHTREEVLTCFQKIKPKDPEKESEAFWNYYSARGWKIGNDLMASLEAAVNNWVRRSEEFSQNKKSRKPDPIIQGPEEPELSPEEQREKDWSLFRQIKAITNPDPQTVQLKERLMVKLGIT